MNIVMLELQNVYIELLPFIPVKPDRKRVLDCAYICRHLFDKNIYDNSIIRRIDDRPICVYVALQKASSNGGVKHFKTNIGHNLHTLCTGTRHYININSTRSLGENRVTYRKMVSFFPYHKETIFFSYS